MNRWLIICIAFLQLASTTQFSQLYKLPILVSHYLEHSNYNLSFNEIKLFVVHHYGGHEMDEDWDTDQKLPFMHADRVHLDPCYIPTYSFNLEAFLIKEIVLPNIIWKDQLLSNLHLSSIWEPPKNA